MFLELIGTIFAGLAVAGVVLLLKGNHEDDAVALKHNIRIKM